jgi:competence protein ComEA
VYSIPRGAIIQDALQAAGGPTRDTALEAVNLAQPIQDGQRIFFPSQADIVAPNPTAFPAVEDASGPPANALLHLNQATAPELELLPGIGPSLAQKIIDYRDEHGPFGRVEDLLDVSGIGPAKLEAVRDLVAVP